MTQYRNKKINYLLLNGGLELKLIVSLLALCLFIKILYYGGLRLQKILNECIGGAESRR